MARKALRNDPGVAQNLIEGITPDAVVADKAFDADALIAKIQASGAQAVIPPQANRVQQRDFDRHQYKHRNLVERFFCRIKEFHGIATRFNKLASRFSAFIALVAAFLNIAAGNVTGPLHRRHRASEFLDFLRAIEAAVPAKPEGHRVMDNYGTHNKPLRSNDGGRVIRVFMRTSRRPRPPG